jgi:plasmid stabilization system protein ParE
MPDTHRVIITKEALSDLEGIARFIRDHSPDNAADVAEAIVGAIDSLGFMPNRFKRAGKSRKHGSPIHAMVVSTFIVYYRVDDQPKAVHLLNIIHGARRQPRRFE